MSLYLDGGARDIKSGFGVLVLNGKEINSVVEARMWGPIVLSDLDPLFVEATRGTNNTGEFTTMIEALIYILYVDRTNRRVELVVDSMLTKDIAQGVKVPSKNIKMAMLMRRLFRLAQAKRGEIVVTHVYSHTQESHKRINNITFNNMNEEQQQRRLKLQKRALATSAIDRKWNAEADDLATMGLENEVQCDMGRYAMGALELANIRKEVLEKDTREWDKQYTTLLEYEQREEYMESKERYERLIIMIHKAAETTIPKPKIVKRTKYSPTQTLINLKEERAKRAGSMTQEDRVTLNRKIAREGKRSYRLHVQAKIKAIEKANEEGDSALKIQNSRPIEWEITKGRQVAHQARPKRSSQGEDGDR